MRATQPWMGATTTIQTQWCAVTVSGWSGRLKCSRFGVCSLKCQNEMAEIKLQNAVDRTRRVKAILRSILRYSRDSLGHCESAVKESEEQIRAMICNTHKCDRDRHAAWLITRDAVKADEQMLFFKLMSKHYHSEGVRCSEASWFHSTVKRSKLTKQWTENHRVETIR